MNTQYDFAWRRECDYVLVVYFVPFWYAMDNTEKFKVFLSSETEMEKMIQNIVTAQGTLTMGQILML